MALFEGRSGRGGYSIVKPGKGKAVLPTDVQTGKSNKPKKTRAKADNGETSQAVRLAGILYEFVTQQLPGFKLTLNKRTGKCEKVPYPVSRKRMIADFETMLDSGEFSAGLIEMVLDWYTTNPGTWEIRSVTSFWRNFSILLARCSRNWNPYIEKEVFGVVQYLYNRFDIDYEVLESVVGRSLFAVEQVLDAVADAGLDRELSYLHSIFGNAKEWVEGHLAESGNSKLGIECFVLTVERVKKQVKLALSGHGRSSGWVNPLEVSMERTAKRIREERG